MSESRGGGERKRFDTKYSSSQKGGPIVKQNAFREGLYTRKLVAAVLVLGVNSVLTNHSQR